MALSPQGYNIKNAPTNSNPFWDPEATPSSSIVEIRATKTTQGTTDIYTWTAVDADGNVEPITVQRINNRDGSDGVTFTPHLSAAGVISWTNDGGLPNPNPVNIMGPQGQIGPQGPVGERGPAGTDGANGVNGVDGTSATVQVGTVRSVPSSSPARVTNVGTANDAIFNFDIPKGEKGEDGDGRSATIEIGTVTTLAPGSPATVENVGTSRDGVFNFGIPAGEQGIQGPTGEQGPAGAQGPQGAQGVKGDDGGTFTPSVSAGGDLSWTNDAGLPNPPTVNIKGPQGDTGATGPIGPQGPSGTDGHGVPAGGNAGQVLAKATNSDYDTEWVDQSGGGGGSTPIINAAATVDNTSGNPSCSVVKSGTTSNPVFTFNFTGINGAQGPQGAQGIQGPAGVGVPTGGNAGQVLAKATGTDYDCEWVDAGGSGPVYVNDEYITTLSDLVTFMKSLQNKVTENDGLDGNMAQINLSMLMTSASIYCSGIGQNASTGDFEACYLYGDKLVISPVMNSTGNKTLMWWDTIYDYTDPDNPVATGKAYHMRISRGEGPLFAEVDNHLTSETYGKLMDMLEINLMLSVPNDPNLDDRLSISVTPISPCLGAPVAPTTSGYNIAILYCDNLNVDVDIDATTQAGEYIYLEIQY